MKPINNSDEYFSGDEKVLWEAFKNGDLAACEQIFRFYYRDLYGYGLKLSGRPGLVKDCIQELFLTLWDRREHLGAAYSIKAYLLASLRRVLLKKLKQDRKKTELRQSNIGIQFSVEELIIQDEQDSHQRRILYQALERLPDRQKEVLYLKYFNGMSYDEIEEILSINYQSIHNHMYRAVTRLRAIMKEGLPDNIL